MTKRSTTNPGGQVCAALHERPGGARLVIAQRKARWELLESRVLEPGVSAAAMLAPLLEKHAVSRLIRIAPARETMARCVQMPFGDDAVLASAVQLIAEAEMPAALPAFRRAGGMVPDSHRGESRSILVTGWRGPDPVRLTPEAFDETWTTPIACLALLRASSSRGAAYAEPDGVACLIVPGADRLVARVLMEEADSLPQWAAALENAVLETCAAAGLPANASEALGFDLRGMVGGGNRLLLDAAAMTALRGSFEGFRDAPAWLDDFGLCLGAILASSSPDPAVRTLASMTGVVPPDERTAIERVAEWVAVPRHAWGVAAAAVAIAIFMPWGIANARLSLADSRAERIKALGTSREEIEKRAALYSQLDYSRQPIAKLLSDISGATPVGVSVTTLRITPEQGLSVQGAAEDSELVNKLEENLNKSGLFSKVTVGRVTARDGSYEFEVTAAIGNPHLPAKGVDDFTTKSLAVRLHGEGASNTAFVSADDGKRRRGGSSSGSAPRASGGDESTSRRPSASEDATPPPPISDKEIAALPRGEAMKMWSSRKKVLQVNRTLDEATKQRLNDEISKLKAQMDKTRSGGA